MEALPGQRPIPTTQPRGGVPGVCSPEFPSGTLPAITETRCPPGADKGIYRAKMCPYRWCPPCSESCSEMHGNGPDPARSVGFMESHKVHDVQRLRRKMGF